MLGTTLQKTGKGRGLPPGQQWAAQGLRGDPQNRLEAVKKLQLLGHGDGETQSRVLAALGGERLRAGLLQTPGLREALSHGDV